MTAFQLARIPILVGLLLLTGPLMLSGMRAAAEIKIEAVWGPWTLLAAIMIAFVVVMLVARQRRHPMAILTIEGLVAAALGLVPPIQWVSWFGISGAFIEATGGTIGLFGIMQPLAIAWLGVVVFTGTRQIRADDPADDASSNAPSERQVSGS